MTLRYAEVIGDPVAHSKSPLIHGFWLGKRQIAAEYLKTHVLPGHVESFLAARREDPCWQGCNVTIPHKQVVTAFLDGVQRQASRVGAVNCIYREGERLIGENSDVDGVLEAIGTGPFGRACLIGAGGAARAALHALEIAGVGEANIVARDRARGQALIDSFRLRGRSLGIDEAEAALAGVDVVINASPLGMDGQPPMSPAVLAALGGTAEAAIIFDMVYAPLDTALLDRARALGRPVADGLAMLIGQAATAFRLFFGEPAPREHDAELRALLTA
jgi:shikimate dehydrogenase